MRPCCHAALSSGVVMSQSGRHFLADGTQVLAEFFDGGASEEPVAIVDLVNDKAGFQHDHMRDHRIVDGIGVFGDVEVLLNDTARSRKGRASARLLRCDIRWSG